MSSENVRGFNFRALPVNRENRENWIPRKFPAIRYNVSIKTSHNIYVSSVLKRKYTQS